MKFLNVKSLARSVSVFAVCATLGITHVSAYSMRGTTLEALPAADTRVTTIGVISTVNNTPVGSVRTTEEMSKAKADLEAQKAAEEAAKKAAAEAAKKAAEEAAKKAAAKTAAAKQTSSGYAPSYVRTVSRSSAYAITDAIKVNGKSMGSFRLSFYCSCELCSGPYGTNTASGATTTEGRTIAVDPRVIPLGSKVYIEGFGDFIAEDTGGAIKGNKIDVYVNDHDRAYALGITNASVYVMS